MCFFVSTCSNLPSPCAEFSNLRVKQSSLVTDQTFEAMRILLRTDDFLFAFLSYLVNNKAALSDPFLTSTRVLQNIIDYSNRDSISNVTQSLAEKFLEVVFDKLSTEETQQRVNDLIDDTVADENLMIRTVFYDFQSFALSLQYQSWVIFMKSEKKSTSQMMLLRLIEMRRASNV